MSLKGAGMSLGDALRIVHQSFSRFYSRLALLALVSSGSALTEVATAGTIVTVVWVISSPARELRREILGYPLVLGAGHLLLVGAGLIVARILLQSAGAYVGARLTAAYETHARARMFEGFIDAAWERQSEEKSGHLLNLLTTNVGSGSAVLTALITGTVAGFSFLMITASAFVINPIAVLAILSVVAVIFVLVRPLSTRARQYATERGDLNLLYAHEVSQAVSLAREIRVFDVGAYFKRRIGEISAGASRNRSRAAVLAAMVPVLYQNLAGLVVLAGLAVIASVGTSSLVSLSVVVLLLLRALVYSAQLQSVYHQANDTIPMLQQKQTVEDGYRRAALDTRGEPLARIESLAFEGVGFEYRPGEPVLEEVGFEIGRGQIIGIVGPSGSGKSTCTQILLRLRDPTRGRYLVNGRPAQDHAPASWFKLVAVVPQEPELLDETVLDNIVFHRDEVTRQDAERAARLAHVHDEILAWPRGYDTPVGDRGSAISGGQRQRICIARALAHRPDMIVFDEPTSALDVHSEAAIQRTLQDLRGEVTVFVIAHRLSTLSICDRIMVFRGGRLQAFGPASAISDGDPYYNEALRLSGLR